MKKVIVSAAFILFATMAFSQHIITENHHHNCYFPKNSSRSLIDCANPDLEYYLKRPPIVTDFTVTEDRSEKIELVLKDEYNFSEIEINFFQIVYNPDTGWWDIEDEDYPMFDDGTHGDEVANDKIFTNNEILLKYNELNTYVNNHVTINVIYKENGQEIHSDAFPLEYISVNSEFLNTIDIPNVYRFENEDYLFTDNFIYYNKYDNWTELECNQIGGELDYNYVISKSLLYDYWSSNIISSGDDKNTYLQVDFTNPGGQFFYNEDIALRLGSLNGVEIHEILHHWIPNITPYLGYEASDAHNGHHANIFKNTSGFLYNGWSRLNGIYCENSLNDFDSDSGGDYLYIDLTTNYELCDGVLETNEDKLYFNDFELYIMNLIPIEDVEFPIISLKNIYNIEVVTDSNTGAVIGRKLYFESLYEVNQAQLETAKIDMLNVLGNRPIFDASAPNNFYLTFSGNKSNLSNNEIKVLWLLQHDMTTTSQPYREYSANNFYKATGDRAVITANIPLPLEYTGNFYTTEYITIEEGEEYQGWTESGEYTRVLESTQYNDSIVTTHLTVIDPLLINDFEYREIQVYPNPTSNGVRINIGENNSLSSIQLFNIQGQILRKVNSSHIDLSSFSSGIYFLKVHTDKGTITKRIIKQ